MRRSDRLFDFSFNPKSNRSLVINKREDALFPGTILEQRNWVICEAEKK